jgi:5'-3' exonuclease
VDIDKNTRRSAAIAEDLRLRSTEIVSIMEAMKVPILRKQRYEADDLIATLCRKLATRNWIFTS